MGTTNTTTGSNTSSLNFNPLAQQTYNNLVGSGGNVLQGYINNPFSNAMYTMGAGQSQAGAQAAGANNMAALNQNQLAMGLGGQAGQGFMAAQRAQTGRANQAMMSQANVSNVLSALQRQMAAAGTGMSFSPQLTGQSGNFSQQSTQGGLGSWLPQLLSGGLSAGMGLAGMMGGGLGSGANAASATSSALGGLGGVMSPSTWGTITGSGMAGVNPSTLTQTNSGSSPMMNIFGLPGGNQYLM